MHAKKSNVRDLKNQIEIMMITKKMLLKN